MENQMPKKRYCRKYGKLIRKVEIPVDADLRARVDAIKQTTDFNAWARDLIYTHLSELEDPQTAGTSESPV